MKKNLVRLVILMTFLNVSINLSGIDSLKYRVSYNYYKDLSDTYLGGSIFMGEFSISHAWYGASLGFGHFLSQPTFILRLTVEEINKTVDIPVEEMAVMQMGLFSIYFSPINAKWVTTDILFGVAFAKASYLAFENVFYNYSFNENKFQYLYTDNQLIKKEHFGYQAGFNISFFPVKNAGIQLNSRIQHLNNGGSFFFVGGGVCFRF